MGDGAQKKGWVHVSTVPRITETACLKTATHTAHSVIHLRFSSSWLQPQCIITVNKSRRLHRTNYKMPRTWVRKKVEFFSSITLVLSAEEKMGIHCKDSLHFLFSFIHFDKSQRNLELVVFPVLSQCSWDGIKIHNHADQNKLESVQETFAAPRATLPLMVISKNMQNSMKFSLQFWFARILFSFLLLFTNFYSLLSKQ